MTRYETLKDKPQRFVSLTGYTLESFRHFCRPSPSDFWSSLEHRRLMVNTERNRRYTLYKNSCLPTHEDQLLFILIYLRKAMTQDVLGELFGILNPSLTNGFIAFCLY